MNIVTTFKHHEERLRRVHKIKFYSILLMLSSAIGIATSFYLFFNMYQKYHALQINASNGSIMDLFTFLEYKQMIGFSLVMFMMFTVVILSGTIIFYFNTKKGN